MRPRRKVHLEFPFGDRNQGFPQPYCAFAYTPQAVTTDPNAVTCSHCKKIIQELQHAK